MKIKNIYLILMALSIVTLLGCTTLPKQLIISLEPLQLSPFSYHNKTAQLTVKDMRNHNYLVRISDVDEPEKRLSSQTSLVSLINQELSQALQQQSLTLNTTSSNKITVIIEQAVVNVEQESFKHKTNSAFLIKLIVNNGQQTLNKSFPLTTESSAPLSVDIAVIERDFRQNISTLLSQLINDSKLHTFIQ